MKLKYIFLIVFIKLNFIVFSQTSNTNSGTVIFKIKANSSVFDSAKSKTGALFNLINSVKNKEFKLNFNNHESTFELIKELNNDITPLKNHFAKSLTGGNYYSNTIDSTLIKEIEFDGDQFFIDLKYINKQPWKITKETKQIGEYTCLKATKNFVVTNSAGKHHLTATAWFTPEIPVKFGPGQFNGLPGLILELYDRTNIFYASNISFNENITINSSAYKNKKLINEDEFEQITNQSLNNFKDMIK